MLEIKMRCNKCIERDHNRLTGYIDVGIFDKFRGVVGYCSCCGCKIFENKKYYVEKKCVSDVPTTTTPRPKVNYPTRNTEQIKELITFLENNRREVDVIVAEFNKSSKEFDKQMKKLIDLF